MKRSIEISVRHGTLRVERQVVRDALAVLDAHSDLFRKGCPEGELSIAFLTDDALADLHGDFLDDPTTTDVITFEGEAALGVAGEICVSADKAASFASQHDRDFSEELTLYVVHGWLHLAGYDDLKPALKRVMRRAEKRAMKLLAAQGLLNAFSWKRRKTARR